MSTPAEISPPPFPLLPSHFPVSGQNNGITSRSQISTRQGESESSTSKKPRISDDASMPPSRNMTPLRRGSPPLPSANPSQNIPQNNNISNKLFFKTRLCHKFRMGSCPYGNNCSFAHGPEELREAPPNWQDILASLDEDRLPAKWSEQQRIHKLKICRKFYSGEGCPYGNRCTFLHEEPGRSRDSSAITVGTTETRSPVEGKLGNGSCNPDINISAGSSGSLKACIWKARSCHKWELTGSCPFGETCHFAHGVAELNSFGGHIDVEGNSRVSSSKLLPNAANDVPLSKIEPACMHEAREKGFWRLKGPKKMNNIYADWIDDVSACAFDKAET